MGFKLGFEAAEFLLGWFIRLVSLIVAAELTPAVDGLEDPLTPPAFARSWPSNWPAVSSTPAVNAPLSIAFTACTVPGSPSFG
jgi:hypothetical protein